MRWFILDKKYFIFISFKNNFTVLILYNNMLTYDILLTFSYRSKYMFFRYYTTKTVGKKYNILIMYLKTNRYVIL